VNLFFGPIGVFHFLWPIQLLLHTLAADSRRLSITEKPHNTFQMAGVGTATVYSGCNQQYDICYTTRNNEILVAVPWFIIYQGRVNELLPPMVQDRI
jgi:hypothetical protein